MAVQLILLQVIAHLLSDFVFQPQSWCDKKEKDVFSPYHIYHISIVFVCAFVFSLDFGFWKAALLMSIIHFLLDGLKSYLLVKGAFKDFFFIDQLLHIITIVGVVLLYDSRYGIHFLLELETKTLAIVAGFVLCAKPANIIIKSLFQAFSIDTSVDPSENKDEKGLPNAGKLIGISERFLTLAFILLGQYEAVGLIIAAKSILRFNATQKSEYVLVGTLLSFSIAAFTGMVINLALTVL